MIRCYVAPNGSSPRPIPKRFLAYARSQATSYLFYQASVVFRVVENHDYMETGLCLCTLPKHYDYLQAPLIPSSSILLDLSFNTNAYDFITHGD